jgi:methionine-rich copper-binding protein CopC
MFRTLIVLSALALSSPVLAHTKLVNATPAANATVAKTAKITLVFSEKVMPQFAGATVTMTGMPGMADHAPMKMAATSTMAKDGKTMTITLARPLPAGTYKVEWRAAGSDMHKMNDSYSFTVK